MAISTKLNAILLNYCKVFRACTLPFYDQQNLYVLLSNHTLENGYSIGVPNVGKMRWGCGSIAFTQFLYNSTRIENSTNSSTTIILTKTNSWGKTIRQ
jgi:hypothetical protein